MKDVKIFGYGSLVHCGTHAYRPTVPVRLVGWKRIWWHTTRRDVAFLNVIPDPNASIDGLLLDVPASAPELDAREFAYRRIEVAQAIVGAQNAHPSIKLFAIDPSDQQTPRSKQVILLSYIDVVVGGYLREFGQEGVANFFSSTDGWDTPILDDRKAPRYPRHQPTDAVVCALSDRWLTQVGAHIVTDGGAKPA